MEPRLLFPLAFALGFVFAVAVIPLSSPLASLACPADWPLAVEVREPAAWRGGAWRGGGEVREREGEPGIDDDEEEEEEEGGEPKEGEGKGDAPAPRPEKDASPEDEEPPEGEKPETPNGATKEEPPKEDKEEPPPTGTSASAPAATPKTNATACDPLDEEGPDCNPLWKIALAHEGRGMHKWSGYFDAYHRHFKRFRARRKVVLVEIGVQSGGSIDMWQAYFGPNRLEYHGVDFNPEVVKFQGPGVHIHIGDQANRTFWRAFRRSVPPPDIVIDDGGHKMVQQRVAFEEELLHLKEGGMYLCEDLHTSYMADYGGAYRKNGTMVEYLKGLVDSLNAFQSEEDHFKIDAFSARIRAIYFYASMAFVYKKATEAMEASEYGTEFIEYGLGGNVEEPEDPGEMEVPEE